MGRHVGQYTTLERIACRLQTLSWIQAASCLPYLLPAPRQARRLESTSCKRGRLWPILGRSWLVWTLIVWAGSASTWLDLDGKRQDCQVGSRYAARVGSSKGSSKSKLYELCCELWAIASQKSASIQAPDHPPSVRAASHGFVCDERAVRFETSDEQQSNRQYSRQTKPWSKEDSARTTACLDLSVTSTQQCSYTALPSINLRAHKPIV